VGHIFATVAIFSAQHAYVVFVVYMQEFMGTFDPFSKSPMTTAYMLAGVSVLPAA
jgi:hypothetical protein